MIFNFANAVIEIKSTTLENSWKKLVLDEETTPEMKMFETEVFYDILYESTPEGLHY